MPLTYTYAVYIITFVLHDKKVVCAMCDSIFNHHIISPRDDVLLNVPSSSVFEIDKYAFIETSLLINLNN